MGRVDEITEYLPNGHTPNGNGNGSVVKAVDKHDKQVEQSISQSVVVDLPPYWGTRLWGIGGYENTLPGIDRIERQAYLALLRTHPQNAIFQAGYLAFYRQVAGVGYEISGKQRAEWFQDVFNNADRGRGWAALLHKILWDYTTLDDGAVMEIIGKGEPDSYLPRQLITGLGYLDSRRCFFTDNYEFPVYYQDYYGKLHKMHHSRVVRFVDLPFGAQELFGRGFCALSRAIAWVQQSISVMTYTGELLSDTPPLGMINVGKVLNDAEFKDSYAQYQAARRQAGNSTYKPYWWNTSKGEKMDVDFIRFAAAPEGYDFEKYTRLQAQGIAASLGIDPQDILPLVSGSFGTGQEAKTLDRKAQGKTLGFLFREFERILNRAVLPDNLEFKFKDQNTEQSERETANAKTQLEIATMLQGISGVSSEAVVRYIAETVEEFRDVLLDEDGNLRVYDDDVKEPQQITPEIAAEQQALPGQAPQAQQPNAEPTAGDVQATPATNAPIVDDTQKAYTVKAYEDVRLRFVSSLEDTLTGASDQDFNRRRAGTIIRALIAKEGREAYKEGLAQGGVEVDVLEGDDLDRYNRLTVEASGYVSNLTEYIYANGLTEAQIKQRADMWSNVTLQKFYQWGIESGDKNGMYMWKLGPTEEHCSDCARLNGQIHRFKEWRKADWMPASQRLECNGYNCQCKLVKTKGRPRGRF